MLHSSGKYWDFDQPSRMHSQSHLDSDQEIEGYGSYKVPKIRLFGKCGEIELAKTI